MVVTDVERLTSAVPTAMLVVDYSPVIERFVGLAADEIESRLRDDDELLACLGLVRHRAVSREWVRLYGVPDRPGPGTIDTRLPDPAAYPTLRASLIEQLTAPFEGVTVIDREHIAPTATGDDRVVRSHWRAAQLPDGTADYSLIVITDLDVTELRTAESTLAASDRLESIGRLAAGIAHEINTPMQYIGDNTQFLQKGFERLVQFAEAVSELADLDGEVRDQRLAEVLALVSTLRLPFLTSRIPRALEQSLDGVATVTRIVRAMKEYSHPGSGRMEPVDLNEVVETTLTVSRNAWKYVAEVDLDLDPALAPVLAIPGELNQVILNLVVNAAHAIEASHDGSLGRIVVRTFARDGAVVISVGDDGGGIPVEVADRVFEPFFTTKGVGKGTGQGLSISRSIVEDNHGGRIVFDSRPGDGTTFEVSIPLHSLDERVPA